MTRMKTTLALLLGLIVLAVAAPVASAAGAAEPLRAAAPEAVAAKLVAPEKRAQVLRLRGFRCAVRSSC
jgi:hypothetical protein